MEPEDLTVIGHTDDNLVDIYTAKYGAYLHFTVVLNAGGKGAQFRRNGCSICAVEVRNLVRNTHDGLYQTSISHLPYLLPLSRRI